MENELPPLDVERIVTAFVRHGVDFLVVGGVAGQIHGAERTTQDLDAVVQYGHANLERLVAAMRELGARIRAEGFADYLAKQAAASMLHPEMFTHGEITTWTTDGGPLDILHDMPDRDGTRRTYEELTPTSRRGVVAGVSVRVVGLSELIASKEVAGWDNTVSSVLLG